MSPIERHDPPRIGIKVPNWGSLGASEALSSTARLAEQRGFDSVWVSDHVVMPTEPANTYPFSSDGRPPFDPRSPFQDPFVALGFVAAITSRVRLGVGVLVLPLRNPILVAKQAATLDVLSGGRLVLGIGTGWMREEFELLERAFDARGKVTDDAIATMRACWEDDPVDLANGCFGPVAMAPKPTRGSRLPVWVGGHSTPALRRAANTGDGWYGSNVGPDDFARLAAEVRDRRAASARSGEPISLGIKVPVGGIEDAATLRSGYAAAGADEIVFDMDMENLTEASALAQVERLADALGLDEREM